MADGFVRGGVGVVRGGNMKGELGEEGVDCKDEEGMGRLQRRERVSWEMGGMKEGVVIVVLGWRRVGV